MPPNIPHSLEIRQVLVEPMIKGAFAMLTRAVIMGHEGDRNKKCMRYWFERQLPRKLLPTACHAMILSARQNMLQRQQIHNFWVKSVHPYVNLTSCLTQNHPSKRLLFGCCLSCLCQVSISNLTAIPGMQSLTLRQCKHSPIFLIIIRISVTRRTVERWYCCGLDAPHESAWRVGIDFSYDWCLAVGKDTNCWTQNIVWCMLLVWVWILLYTKANVWL